MRDHAAFRLLAVLFALATAILASCADDDDGDNDAGDDDLGDDDATDDDDSDDDDGDDDVAPLDDLGWMILCDDPDHAAEIIEAAPSFGVDRIILSHAIIDNIDEINEDQEVTQLVETLAGLVQDSGMVAHIWVHEFSEAVFSYLVCFDPADPYWENRRIAYRNAIDRIPALGGVNVTMGSGDPPPWAAMCLCQYCLDLPPFGHPAMDLLNSVPDERIRLVVNTLAEAVVDERGRELVVHTFYHYPDEVPWMRDALAEDPRTNYRVLTKNVPNDWQPYYPPNPLLGDVGDHDQITGFDLGGEYWGQSVLPFCQVDQIQMRLEQALARGVRAVNARVERGCRSALGTPNEVNLFALSRFAEQPDRDPQAVWEEWTEQRYGLLPGSEEARTLIGILASTFDVGRKMYYVEGFWTFVKSSGFPDSAREPEMLAERSNARWDTDWQSLLQELRRPTEETLSRIWQEKTEAVDQAAANLAALDSLTGFLEPVDWNDLHDRLLNQWYCTRLWRLAGDIIFRYQFVRRTGDEQQKRFLEGSARALSALADEVEDELGADAWPGRPGDIREFLEDLREVFPAQEEHAAFDQMALSRIQAREVTSDSAVIVWNSDEPATGQVKFGIDLPDYGLTSHTVQDFSLDHLIALTGLSPSTRYYFRVHSVNAAGLSVVSGDYRFRTTAH